MTQANNSPLSRSRLSLEALQQHAAETSEFVSSASQLPALLAQMHQDGALLSPRFCALLKQSVPFDHLCLSFPLDPESTEVRYWLFEPSKPPEERSFPLSISQAYYALCTRARQVAPIEDKLPSEQMELASRLWSAEAQSLMIVPLRFKQQWIATLHICSHAPEAYGENHLVLAHLIASNLAPMLAYQELQHHNEKQIEYQSQVLEQLQLQASSEEEGDTSEDTIPTSPEESAQEVTPQTKKLLVLGEAQRKTLLKTHKLSQKMHRQAKLELQEVDRLLDTHFAFLAGFAKQALPRAHDLVEQLERLKAMDEGEERQRLLKSTLVASKEHSASLEELVDYSSCLHGELELKSTEFSMPELIEEVRGQCATVIRNKGIRFQLDHFEQDPLSIEGDREVCSRLLHKLFMQILAVIPANTEFRVVLQRLEDPTETVLVRLLHEFRPLSDEALQTLFSPYQSAFSDPDDEQSQFSLALAQELARVHGGSLKAQPTEDGLCFALSLPLELPAQTTPKRRNSNFLSFPELPQVPEKWNEPFGGQLRFADEPLISERSDSLEADLPSLPPPKDTKTPSQGAMQLELVDEEATNPNRNSPFHESKLAKDAYTQQALNDQQASIEEMPDLDEEEEELLFGDPLLRKTIRGKGKGWSEEEEIKKINAGQELELLKEETDIMPVPPSSTGLLRAQGDIFSSEPSNSLEASLSFNKPSSGVLSYKPSSGLLSFPPPSAPGTKMQPAPNEHFDKLRQAFSKDPIQRQKILFVSTESDTKFPLLRSLRNLDFKLLFLDEPDKLAAALQEQQPVSVMFLSSKGSNIRFHIFETLENTSDPSPLPLLELIQQANQSMRLRLCWQSYQSTPLKETYWLNWLEQVRKAPVPKEVLAVGESLEESRLLPLLEFICGKEYNLQLQQNPAQGVQQLYRRPPELLLLRLDEPFSTWSSLFEEMGRSARTQTIPILLLCESPIDHNIHKALDPLHYIMLQPF